MASYSATYRRGPLDVVGSEALYMYLRNFVVGLNPSIAHPLAMPSMHPTQRQLALVTTLGQPRSDLAHKVGILMHQCGAPRFDRRTQGDFLSLVCLTMITIKAWLVRRHHPCVGCCSAQLFCCRRSELAQGAGSPDQQVNNCCTKSTCKLVPRCGRDTRYAISVQW